MAIGLIVIGSKINGIKEAIKNGENGFLFQTGDSTELENIILNLVKLNSKKLIKISYNARKEIEMRFNKENNSKKLFKLFFSKSS